MVEEAYQNAYLPFLEVLRNHPPLKVVLHYSENLLSWMEKALPEAIDILREFVKSRRVEFLSGACPLGPAGDGYAKAQLSC